VSSAFEGDLIRPLWLLTLYFAYAEFEVDQVLERVCAANTTESWRQRPLGQKLSLLKTSVGRLVEGHDRELQDLLGEGRKLVERRNLLVHSCVFAGGRVVSSRPGVAERLTSAEELSALANGIFTWKERLNVYRSRTLEPLIAKRTRAASPNNAFKGRRAKRARP
jgi:hypothetical protein